MGESEDGRNCNDERGERKGRGGNRVVNSLDWSPRGFAAERLTFTSGMEFQPNHWGGLRCRSHRQPGSEGGSEGGRGGNLSENIGKWGKGVSVICGGGGRQVRGSRPQE
jgi:hypothetical protein